MRIPGDGMANAPKPVGAGRAQRFQYRCCALTQVQVGVTDNGRRRSTGAVESARAGRGQPLDELDLPYGSHLLRPVGAVHRARLDEHRGPHVVAAIDVIGQLVEQVSLIGDAGGAKVPEMVMGIADGQLWLQRRFRGQGEPVIASEWHRSTSVTALGGHRTIWSAEDRLFEDPRIVKSLAGSPRGVSGAPASHGSAV